MYSIAGSVQMVPVHATVSIFHSSGEAPQVTNAAGAGYTMVPGFQVIFPIFSVESESGEGIAESGDSQLSALRYTLSLDAEVGKYSVDMLVGFGYSLLVFVA